MDAIRQRFVTDRVLTASPAQRVVMLYDRLSLDLARANSEAPTDATACDGHLEHATMIVAELAGSLDVGVGGPSENLASLYAWILGELTKARLRPARADLRAVETNVRTLREAWAIVASEIAAAASTAAARAGSGSPLSPHAAAWTA